MSLAKPGGVQKTMSLSSKNGINKKKKRVYTEKELDIPALNSIIPAGIAKPKGQKKGKTFVDDPASMVRFVTFSLSRVAAYITRLECSYNVRWEQMAIMSVVNAEKEGRLESKIAKSRQLEEIREAKRLAADERSDEKKERFEERKAALKKKRKRNSDSTKRSDEGEDTTDDKGKFKPRKRVSFG